MSRRFRTKYQIQPRTPTRKLVSFQLGSEKYAIAIDRVQRIIQKFTPQGVLESGRSLVKHNNETITLIDLSILFLSGEELQERQYLIVCNINNGELLGIPVSQMPSILEVSEDKFSQIPETYQKGELPAAIAKLIYPSDNAVVFYLDVEKIVVR